MAVKRISRRTILRGVGGVGLALPALEIMRGVGPVAAAGGDDPPPRFLVSYAGMSYGKPSADRVVPQTPGPDYELTRGLSPLGDGTAIDGFTPYVAYDVKDQVTVVSNLLIPYNMDPSGPTPAAGIGGDFHGLAPGLIQLTGMRRHDKSDPILGSTADQLVADELFPDMQTLVYRVEPHSYRGYQGPVNPYLSWRLDGDEAQRVDPVTSPQAAYQSMLAEWIPPDPEAAAEAMALLQRRVRAVDLVQDGRKALLARVGKSDRQRLERHFDELSDLERKLQDVGEPPGAACNTAYADLVDPGPDPEETGYNYTGEDERARVLSDLIRLAFVCDSRRVASLMYSHLSQAQLGYRSVPGWPGHSGNGESMHGLTHASTVPEGTADGVAFYVGHFARLAQLLRDSPEPDGSSILDHTVMLFLLEGGRGWSASEGRDSVHSTERMIMLVAGGSALGVRAGEHIVAQQEHPRAGRARCDAGRRRRHRHARRGQRSLHAPTVLAASRGRQRAQPTLRVGEEGLACAAGAAELGDEGADELARASGSARHRALRDLEHLCDLPRAQAFPVEEADDDGQVHGQR